MMKCPPLSLVLFLCASSCFGLELPPSFDRNHTNNWAVLVDTSRFWFNYRHIANVLSIYRSVKRLVGAQCTGVIDH